MCILVKRSACSCWALQELLYSALLHGFCRAWGPGELGGELCDWLDWAKTAGTAAFLDVVLEAHRLGHDHLQRFIDYFGQESAAELLPNVIEVSPASSVCSCWLPSAHAMGEALIRRTRSWICAAPCFAVVTALSQ